jgi:hypothetical protein
MTQAVQVEPQAKKTLVLRLPYCPSIIYGVMKQITKFHSQFQAVDIVTPFALIGSGKISPMTAHTAGPQVEAKKNM